MHFLHLVGVYGCLSFYRTPFCHCHVHFLLSFICNEFQHIHICIFLQILGVLLSRPQWVAVSWFLHVVWFPWKTFASVRSLSFWRLSDKLRYLKPPTSLYLIISSCCTPYCQMAYKLPDWIFSWFSWIFTLFVESSAYKLHLFSTYFTESYISLHFLCIYHLRSACTKYHQQYHPQINELI